MPIKLNTASGGGVILQGANTASDKTITIPADDGTMIYANSSGNVGIGTSSPAMALQVGSTSKTGDSTMYAATGNGAYKSGLVYEVSGQNAGFIGFNKTGSAYLGIPDSTAGFSTTSSIPLVFATQGTERARIDSSGCLIVGKTSAYSGRKLDIAGGSGTAGEYVATVTNTVSSGTPQGFQVFYSNMTPNNTGSEFLYAADATAIRFVVRSNGGIGNYSANNVNLSDRREKTNFAPAGEYLSKICAIPVQTFNYIDQNIEEDDGLTLGVVAQDVQAVAPELVMESNWGTEEEPKMRLSIYQTDLQYALMKCIQEQQAMIEELKAKVAALEAK